MWKGEMSHNYMNMENVDAPKKLRIGGRWLQDLAALAIGDLWLTRSDTHFTK